MKDLVDESKSAAPLGALGAAITRELRDLILSGGLEPERRLIVQELADRFGTSRGPIRDSLRQLRAEGLVVPHGRRGVQVATLTAAEARETVAIRQAVEPVAAEFALHRGPDQLEQCLAERLGAMRGAAEAGDWSALVTTDMELHAVFYELSGVARLQRLWDGMRLPVLHTFRLHRRYYTSPDPLLAEHENLLALVRMRDAELVATFLRGHIGGLVDDLAERLG
ncbi:GntR family transcriptional regulator [Amycolatopsis suaedae]|uniref:GntR family transcriptional regulator n=1 Tax=Amycolatopsis suaedae TaxID=2510978 RepID=A0A4Q7J5R9_9PSEU|nr:GntR family transcriptional regulator [Amycolatopsis suaedae]RZQ62459.1 GntR family transcriptional regulator [Amycolatopsis suaedae]